MNPELGEYGDLLMMPAAMALIAFVFVVALAVVGYSMKWSVNLVEAGPIGFFYGLLTAVVISVAGGFTSVGIALVTGTQNQWVLMAYSMVAAVLALCLMVQCNPFKAFLAYLCNMVISTMLMIGVCIGGALILFVLSATSAVKLPDNAPAMISPAKSGWGGSMSAGDQTRYITGGGGGVQTNPFSQ